MWLITTRLSPAKTPSLMPRFLQYNQTISTDEACGADSMKQRGWSPHGHKVVGAMPPCRPQGNFVMSFFWNSKINQIFACKCLAGPKTKTKKNIAVVHNQNVAYRKNYECIILQVTKGALISAWNAPKRLAAVRVFPNVQFYTVSPKSARILWPITFTNVDQYQCRLI